MPDVKAAAKKELRVGVTGHQGSVLNEMEGLSPNDETVAGCVWHSSERSSRQEDLG